MTADAFRTITLELALSSAGHQFPRLSHLIASCPRRGFPVRIKTRTKGYSIAILDITLTAAGAIHLIEANGSNGGLTSIPFGNDEARARHMQLAFECKGKLGRSVSILVPFKPGFMHLAEFFARAHDFTALLSQRHKTRLCLSDERLGAEQVSVVCGTIPTIADSIERQGRHIFFKGRMVAFACNPNLLPELVRRSMISADDGFYNIDLEFFHEGRLIALIHDKAAQQAISCGTGITPLRHSVAWSFDECLSVIRDFHRRDEVAVGKMNAGSGGAGIGFFPPALSVGSARAKLNRLFQSAEESYGHSVGKTVFPVRFFEFARSTDYLLNDERHLWDIRMQCLIYPNFVEVTPCLIRICPNPFDGRSYRWDSVVSNLTGRKPSLQFVRSAFDKASWKVLGIDASTLRRMATACARWCESGWEWSEE